MKTLINKVNSVLKDIKSLPLWYKEYIVENKGLIINEVL
jgi:hypothetical protein